MIWIYRLFCISMICIFMYFYVIREMLQANTDEERAKNVIGFFGGMGTAFFAFLLSLSL